MTRRIVTLAFPVTAALLLLACGTESREPPSGLAVDRGLSLSKHASAPDDGALIVGNLIPGAGATNNILRFNASSGAFVDIFVPRGSGGLSGTCCMVYGPDENLYVSSGGMTRGIFRYNGATGAFIDIFVPGGSGGLDRPLVSVFGPDGNLYVGDIGTHSIRRYNGTTGAFIDEFVPAGSQGMTGADPQLFVFGPDRNLYVASEATHRILRYNGSTGAFIDVFVPAGSGGLAAPSGLTFGPDGNLYVGSTTTDRILRYNGRTGAFIDEFVTAGSGGLDVPVGLAFGPDRHLYVASATGDGRGSILRYHRRTGKFLDVFVPTGSGGINGPRVILFKLTTTLCHRSPGHPDRTITVGQLSAADHIAHGDVIGACPIWAEPVHLDAPVNSSCQDQTPTLSRDELALYFMSDRPGGLGNLNQQTGCMDNLDLWVARRASRHQSWGTPTNVGSPVNTTDNEAGPALSPDGRLLFFYRFVGTGQRDIYVSRRDDRKDDWEDPVSLGPDVNTAVNEEGPTFLRHGDDGDATLYFDRGSPFPATDLYSVRVSRRGMPLGPAVAVAELNSSVEDNHASVRADGREIFFNSRRPGAVGGAGFDLWVATRARVRDAWSTPVNLGAPVNSSFAEFHPNVSFDGRTLLFIAPIARGGLGGFDIWMTTRTLDRETDADEDDDDDEDDEDEERRNERPTLR